VEAAHDPTDVRDGDERILRLFVAARKAGDGPAATRLWAELLTINYPRVEQLVYLESRHDLSRQEQQDALQLAAWRIAMIPQRKRGFEGTSKGEWINLVKKIVRAACIDTQRKEARHSSRQAPLYAADDGTGAAQLTQDAYKALMEQEQEREDEEQTREELKALSEKFLAWALPKLRESYRMMIECDLQGLPIEEIMDRLDRKRDAVYKLRERAMKALMKLREEYEA
jgi:DNA-directed RNA polymerase specialized sigma24 family protein